MKTVKDILKSKEITHVHTVGPAATVLEAISLMAQHRIGALVVVAGDGRVIGILSERDYARKIVLMERSSYNTEVRDIMTADVITVAPDARTTHCMTLMTEKRLRHLPVVEDGKLLGMVSIGDLVKDVISDQQAHIRHLESYIRGE